MQQIGRFKKFETRAIPISFPYDAIRGFSQEVREKLQRVRPASIGQASRISGVTPAAISLLIVALERYKEQSSLSDDSLEFRIHNKKLDVILCFTYLFHVEQERELRQFLKPLRNRLVSLSQVRRLSNSGPISRNYSGGTERLI